jgi:hypothetical protein
MNITWDATEIMGVPITWDLTEIELPAGGPTTAQIVAAINADPTQITARTNAATAATQATTAATEIGKVPRLSTAIAAGAAARRNKVAATADTLDETLGAVP